MTVVEEVCTITARGQTTVPKAVRQALGVGYGGRIAFRVEGSRVTIRALMPEDEDEGTDPALVPFLSLLEADLTVRPHNAVQPITTALAARIGAIAADIGKIDPDDPIEGEVVL